MSLLRNKKLPREIEMKGEWEWEMAIDGDPWDEKLGPSASVVDNSLSIVQLSTSKAVSDEFSWT